MKKTKTIYWVFTVLFALLMLVATIPDLLILPDSIKYMDKLGYPHYLIPFLGVAKLLGTIAVLIPGFPRIKEWAYAGIAIDLVGATYSQLYVMPSPGIAMMLIWFAALIGSYIYYHKKLKAE